MKKNFITLFMIALPLFGMAQSKVSVEGTTGNLMIGKDRGLNYELGINYHFNESTALRLSGFTAAMDNKGSDIGYDVMKLSLAAEQTVTNSSDISLALVMGFSYISIEDKLLLPKNDFTGVDLGLNFLLHPQKPLSIGLRLVSTYSYDAPGGMLQSNFVMRYRFGARSAK